MYVIILVDVGLLKRKKSSYMEHAMKSARTKSPKPQLVFPLYMAFYFTHLDTATHYMTVGQFALRYPCKKH